MRIDLRGAAWAMLPSALRALASRADSDTELPEEPLIERPRERVGSVAVIGVIGPLVRYGGFWADWMGATSYEQVRGQLRAALADDSVAAIALLVDSPGGELNGCGALADEIFQARGQKPITAYVSGAGTSAAYWLASAADEVVASPTAVLGSIGVVSTFVDTSKLEEQMGIREIEIVSSQSPNKRPDPATDKGRAQIQAELDDLADVFIASAAKHRGIEPAALVEAGGHGGVLVGAKAVAAGLADRVGEFDGGDDTMNPLIAAALGLDKGASEADVAERCKALVGFERAVLAALGASGADDAIGKARAAAEAQAEVAKMRAERAAEAQAATQREFRSMLEQAIAGDKPRLTLGQLAKVVPVFLDEGEAEKATAAVTAVKAQTAAELIAAVCSAQASPRAVGRVRSYLDAQSPVFPTAVHEPPVAPRNIDESDTEARVAEAFKRARAARK